MDGKQCDIRHLKSSVPTGVAGSGLKKFFHVGYPVALQEADWGVMRETGERGVGLSASCQWGTSGGKFRMFYRVVAAVAAAA